MLSPLEQSIKRKIESKGVPLKDWDINIYRGILTGFNEAFVISGAKKDELIAEDPKSAEIIRPILRGKDIKRYKATFADLWLIYVPWHFPLENDTSIVGPSDDAEKLFQEQYPAIYKHLLSYKDDLSKRNKAETGIRYEWYALQRWGANYRDEFSKQKIVWGNLCLSSQFAYAPEGTFINAPATMIVPGNKYVLAVLNSKLGDWYIRQLGVTRNGGYFEYKPMFVDKLPIPQLSDEAANVFVETVDCIINDSVPEDERRSTERLIDNMVYDLYSLTPEERSYIEKY